MIVGTETPIAALIDLSGKSAVVTGGARGIGLQIVRRLAEAGAAVLIGDRDLELAKAEAAALRESGLAVTAFPLDVTDSAANVAIAEAASAKTGSLDLWVGCAGAYPANPTESMSDAEWLFVVNVNLNASYYGARAAVNAMPNGGSIVFISSTASFRPRTDGRAHYTAAKHGVRGLVTALAREWGSRGIRVNAVAPGYTATETNANLASDPDHAAKMVAGVPLGRAGTPDDVARAVLFCASDLSAMVSGVTLPVDGGQLTM